VVGWSNFLVTERLGPRAAVDAVAYHGRHPPRRSERRL
jgi:hypothetical protein